MPSSHLRMEEATSIIASKSITDGFRRPDVDDLDDFVLQIDENEINNEIKANGLVEDVFKQLENGEGKTDTSLILKPLGTNIETDELMNCEADKGPEGSTDKKSCDLEDKEQDQTTVNGICDKINYEIEEETRRNSNSEAKLKIAASDITGPHVLNKEKDDAKDQNKMENSNDAETVVEKVNKTVSLESSGSVVCSEEDKELNLSVIKKDPEETNEFVTENLESVDKELDSLLSMEPDTSINQSNNISEPMEVDPPPKELPVMKMTTIEHSPSVLLELQNQVEEMDSDDMNRIPDSPPVTMHSPQTLKDIDENSNSSDGVLKENISKTIGETDKEIKDEFIYHKVKHIQISAQSNVLKENVDSEKRNKREADNESTNNQKKIKLEVEEEITEELPIRNDLVDESESNVAKKLKKESGTESDSSYDTSSSTGSDSSDESVDMSVPGTLNKIKHKLINEEIPAEALKEIMEGREKLFANYFEGKIDITINRYVLEEMVMTQIIEWISYKSDVGQLRQKCRILENEQIRMNQMVYALKKQADNAKLIIKKLIDEKANNQSWTQNAIPLKVTRSVGLQVCTCGSMTVRSKFFDKDCKSPKNDKVLDKDSTSGTSNSGQNSGSNVDKVGSSDNKENISSNIEKDATSSKDSNADDVVIVSVTENKSTSSSTSINKDSDLTIRKIVEPPKNGAVSTEKVLRKPPGIEYTNSAPIQNKPSVTHNSKKLASDNSPLEKESSRTTPRTSVSEIIDLTDKEDQPVKKLEESSKSKPVPTSISSEKPTAGTVEKSKNMISSHPSSLAAVNGVKKPPVSSSTAIKKPVDISAPAADLVNSYDHLPKYPVSPKYPPNVTKPPRPILRIGKNTSGKQGIMLSWSFEGGRNPPNIEEYQLYAYQESKNSEKLKTDTWKKVGDIKALPLPMACFLTQFVEGHKYHFIVRAVDTQKRLGDFSLPGSIILHAAGQPPSAS